MSMRICQGGMLCNYLTILFIDAKVYSIHFILCTTWCLLGGKNEVGRFRRKYQTPNFPKDLIILESEEHRLMEMEGEDNKDLKLSLQNLIIGGLPKLEV